MTHAFIASNRCFRAPPVISTKRNEKRLACPAWIYNNRNNVGRLWVRLKERRAVATSYEKAAISIVSILCLAAIATYSLLPVEEDTDIAAEPSANAD